MVTLQRILPTANNSSNKIKTKSMKKILALSIIAISVYACSSSKNETSTPVEITEAQVAHGATKFPGLTKADLEEGRTLYAANCNSCHKLYKATSENEAGWKKIIPPMSRKAKIDDATQQKITKYLLTMCDAK